MHHMNSVRKSISSLKSKYRNHASRIPHLDTEQDLIKLEKYYVEWDIKDHLDKYIEVPNQFNINLGD